MTMNLRLLSIGPLLALTSTFVTAPFVRQFQFLNKLLHAKASEDRMKGARTRRSDGGM